MLCFNFLALACPLFKHAFGLLPACPSLLWLRRGAEKLPPAHTSSSRKPNPLKESAKGGGTAEFINNKGAERELKKNEESKRREKTWRKHWNRIKRKRKKTMIVNAVSCTTWKGEIRCQNKVWEEDRKWECIMTVCSRSLSLLWSSVWSVDHFQLQNLWHLPQ